MEDILGETLQEGDYVAFSMYEESRMQLGQVVGFTVKQAKIKPLFIIKPKNRRVKLFLAKPFILRKSKHVVKVSSIPEEYVAMPPEWVGKLFRK